MCWNKKDIKFRICFDLRSIEQTTTCGRQSKFLRPYQKPSSGIFCNQPTSRHLLPLTTTTTGNYYHWQLLPLATTTTGNYYHWQLLPLATTTTGNYYHWQLVPLATTTTGNYYHWQLLPLATTGAHCFGNLSCSEDQPGAVEHAWGSQGGQEGEGTYLIRHSLPNYWHFHSASRLSFWFMSRGML